MKSYKIICFPCLEAPPKGASRGGIILLSQDHMPKKVEILKNAFFSRKKAPAAGSHAKTSLKFSKILSKTSCQRHPVKDILCSGVLGWGGVSKSI